MKVKNLVWIILLVIIGTAAGYIGTDEVSKTDYWVLGIVGIIAVWWVIQWKKKVNKDSSGFLKKINEKMFT